VKGFSFFFNTEQERKHFFFEKKKQKPLDMRQIRIERAWLPCVRPTRIESHVCYRVHIEGGGKNFGCRIGGIDLKPPRFEAYLLKVWAI
jgi:hypothetical protein